MPWKFWWLLWLLWLFSCVRIIPYMAWFILQDLFCNFPISVTTVSKTQIMVDYLLHSRLNGSNHISSLHQIKFQILIMPLEHMIMYGPLSSFWISHDDVIKWKHFPRYWSFVRIPHTKASDAELWCWGTNVPTGYEKDGSYSAYWFIKVIKSTVLYIQEGSSR